MSRRAAATLAWLMWVIGLTAIAVSDILTAPNPTISTTQVPENGSSRWRSRIVTGSRIIGESECSPAERDS